MKTSNKDTRHKVTSYLELRNILIYNLKTCVIVILTLCNLTALSPDIDPPASQFWAMGHMFGTPGVDKGNQKTKRQKDEY